MKNLRSTRGFTLIEVLIAVAIVAIIAAIAFPSYQSQVQRSKRAEAKVELSQVAQRLQRCFSQYGVYNHANCSVGTTHTTENGLYEIAIATTATSYTLTATAKQSQLGDEDCRVLIQDSTGLKTANPASGAAGSTTDKCWR